MNSSETEACIDSEEAIRLFALGELVVAKDMSSRLYAADFCVSEDELLDPLSWLRAYGLPVVRVLGILGEFFCPSAVIGFLEMHLWDNGYLLLPPQRLEALD
ncbi:MAG: hypothetical protein HGB30_00075 [Holophagaceae bacterium]|nr:hypothetical protein [Holophagaceae bacterium]